MTLDENAFRRLAPALSHDPDMVEDDLPTNPDYIDVSYGSAAGVRDLTDEDLDEFDDGNFGGRRTPTQGDRGVVSITGGETVKMLTPEGLNVIEGYYDNLPLNTDNLASEYVSQTLVHILLRGPFQPWCNHLLTAGERVLCQYSSIQRIRLASNKEDDRGRDEGHA